MKIFRILALVALAADTGKVSAALLVNLDATGLPAGSLPVWDNLVDSSALNDFTRNGASVAAVQVVSGTPPVKALFLSGTTDFYVGPEAPASVTGTGQRTIEVWVRNPSVADEETIFAWGRRGGPDATNMVFGYGTNAVWGATGQWGPAFDMDWAGAPAANEWHYLVYTYDGAMVRIYSDGEQRNYRPMPLATYYRNPGAARLKFLVGAQNDASGNPVSFNVSYYLARLRVHNVAFTALQVRDGYSAEAAAFGRTALPPVTGPGAADLMFDPNADEEVDAFAMQPDGKIVIGGVFTAVGGLPRSRFARLLPNGTPEPGEDVAANEVIQSVGVQTDGRIVLTGAFSNIRGFNLPRAARLLPDGNPDQGFVPNPNSDVRCQMIDDNGAIMLGGPFTSMFGTGRNFLARVNFSGALDGSFNPGPDAQVRTVALQPDGKLLIAGNFSTIAGGTRSRLARVNANGTLDTAFNSFVAGTAVYCMALQADGKIVIGGLFTTVGGVSRINLARLNSNGTLDTGFNPGANDIVRSMVIQTDGKIIVTGNFTVVGAAPRNRIARLNPGGTVDAGFNPNANAIIFGTLLQPDGKVLVGGEFTMVAGVPRNFVARLENEPATQSLTIPDHSRIQWLRGGSSPETNLVRFELSTDGGNVWTMLGPATRIDGGWVRAGLSLPPAGKIRARARTTGGYGNGSTGLVETTAHFSGLDIWRQTHFGTAENAGIAANDADPDKDGLENLVEYAFDLNPNVPDATALPAWEKDDNDYVLTFTRPPSATGITYMAEYSDSLNPGSWTAAANAGTGDNYVFYTTATGPRLYLRVRVTGP
jgi:uncharacterized delta-60 repeat protein